MCDTVAVESRLYITLSLIFCNSTFYKMACVEGWMEESDSFFLFFSATN